MIAVVLAAACGGESPTGVPDAQLFGTYNLQTINGASLPYFGGQIGADSIFITGVQLTLSDGGVWTDKVMFLTTDGIHGSSTVGGDNGTWSESGSSLSFFSTKNNKTAYTGTFSGTRLDLHISGGSTFVFAR
jgi:hypothetical protein